MEHPYEDSGLGWVFLAFSGFIVGYILTKLKIVPSSGAATFCAWFSAVVAGIFVFGRGLDSYSLINIAGSVAFFGLIWFVFGLVFTLGFCMGAEKADKKK